MPGTPRTLLLAAVIALALAGAAGATTVLVGGRGHPGHGPAMMGSGYGGMMGGGYGAMPAAPRTGSATADPAAVRSRVEGWLRSHGFGSFRVSEVMAFSRNDYVAVRDGKGRPAFELLAGRTGGWLMEEPPSMMWNSRYGMMRGLSRSWMSGMGAMMGGWNGYSTGSGKVTSVLQAARAADRWLARARPGERVSTETGGMGAFPGYFTLDTTRNGKTAGMISVNAATGAVWYHGWHGDFLAEREF